jgi:hypothetical protein
MKILPNAKKPPEPGMELATSHARCSHVMAKCKKGGSDAELVQQIDRLVPVDVCVSPQAPALRVRHVIKHGTDCYLL